MFLYLKNVEEDTCKGEMFLLDDDPCSIFRNIFSIERVLNIYDAELDIFTSRLNRLVGGEL